jgi:hypothetical protein
MSTTPSPTVPLSELRGDRVDLPSGGWVQLRHLDDLRSRDREAITAAIPSLQLRPVDILRMQRKVIEVMVVAWEVPYLEGAPLPKDAPEILGELTLRDENLLLKRIEPVMQLVDPKDVDPADHEDPDSPTGPVGGSTPA